MRARHSVAAFVITTWLFSPGLNAGGHSSGGHGSGGHGSAGHGSSGHGSGHQGTGSRGGASGQGAGVRSGSPTPASVPTALPPGTRPARTGQPVDTAVPRPPQSALPSGSTVVVLSSRAWPFYGTLGFNGLGLLYPRWSPFYGYGYSYGYGYPYSYGYAPFYNSDESSWQGAGFASPSPFDTFGDSGSLRLRVDPRTAQVFVDGYYAGVVDDFDGHFQHLELTPGSHHVEIRADGYDSLFFDIVIQPHHKLEYRGALRRSQP